MRFREHGLDKPIIEAADKAAVVAYLRERFACWPDLDDLDPADIEAEQLDNIIIRAASPSAWWCDWPALYIVRLDRYGVVGYADGPLGK
jgi:hypothetical protein